MRPLPLVIRTTGVEDYIDGSANIKMLIIGGPDTGKTRMSSFWPKPFYADCESGRASIADRKVQYAEIKTSQDMLDFLAYAKQFERLPKNERPFQTIVVDTIDAFQRKVKDEWVQANRKPTFTGREAWGYLDSKLQMVMTRLLNLDANVLVLAHFKDKVIRDGDNETREVGLQLQGDIANTIFADFDLVGWMGTYYAAEGGERVEKRGLSFKKSPDRPFLKDRFGVMPSWLPVDFTEDDYGRVFEAFLSRVDKLEKGEIVGEIESVGDEDTIPTAGVVGPEGGAGALPPVNPADIPLAQHDKPTLMKKARDLGITTKSDGTPIRGNTTKGELVEAIEYHQKKTDSGSESPAAPVQAPAQAAPAAPADTKPEASKPAPEKAPVKPETAPEQVKSAQDDGLKPGEKLDPATGEVTHDQAVKNVQNGLGGQVVSDQQVAEAPQAAKPADPWMGPPPAPAAVCEECGKDLSAVKPDIVRLSKIRFRKALCAEHYQAAKSAA